MVLGRLGESLKVIVVWLTVPVAIMFVETTPQKVPVAEAVHVQT
jgi:hypothetical protein